MAVFEDGFTDTSATNLSSHTPTLIAGGAGSGSWSYGTAANVRISSANRARSGTGGSGNTPISSATPPSRDVDVEADLVVFTMPGTNLFVGVIAHANNDATDTNRDGYYLFLGGGSGGTLTLQKVGSGGSVLGTVAGATWNTGGGSNAVYHLKLTVRQSGANNVLNAYVTRDDGQYLKSDGTYQSGSVACITATDSSSPYPARPGAIAFFDTANGDSSSIHIDNYRVLDATAFVPGVASIVDATDTQVNLSATAGTGNNGSVTLNWQRSTTASGGFSDLSGLTSLTGADTTAVAGMQYFYRMKYTDSATTVYSDSRPGNLWGAPVILGIIGDSISTGSGGTDPAPMMIAALSKMTQQRRVTIGSNQAQSGSTTANWIPGAPSNYLSTAKTAFSGVGVTHISIMLGTNGSFDATYSSNMAAILADLVGAGYVCILHDSPYGTALTEAWNQDIYEMKAINAGLIDGTTILRGDTLSYEYFGSHVSELTDGVHPTTAGKASLGMLWANAIDRALNIPASGGGSPLIGGGLVRV